MSEELSPEQAFEQAVTESRNAAEEASAKALAELRAENPDFEKPSPSIPIETLGRMVCATEFLKRPGERDTARKFFESVNPQEAGHSRWYQSLAREFSPDPMLAELEERIIETKERHAAERAAFLERERREASERERPYEGPMSPVERELRNAGR